MIFKAHFDLALEEYLNRINDGPSWMFYNEDIGISISLLLGTI